MRRAFTLIELLVVIAIIAVLAAILFPVFAQAKAAAKQSTCLSNFKQFGLAFALYGNDFDDSLINPSGYDRIQSTTGESSIDPYIKNAGYAGKVSIYLCPNDSMVYTASSILGNNFGWKGYPTTYAMNVFLQPGNAADPDPDACFTPASDQLSVSWFGTPYSNESSLFDNAYKYNMGGVSQSAIAAPSSTDLLFESVVEAGDVQTDAYVGMSQRGGDYMNAQGFFYTQAQANKWYVSNMAFTLQGAVTPWHNQMNNYLFADSHAKGRAPERQGYDITQHPSDNIWLVHDGRDGSTPIAAAKC